MSPEVFEPRKAEAQVADDERLFTLLEEYRAAVAAGDQLRRQAWLTAHPELAGLANCLEALDSLAPAADRPVTETETLIVGDAEVPASDARPAVQPSFGKYELLEELGRGGMGVVFRARQTDLGRDVALKMILASHFASAEALRRFYQEAKAAGGLRHPHVVGVHEVGQIDGQHYFTMDYVGGPTLAEKLAGGPLDPDQAAACLAAVARAVDYLHAHKIVHRDLKPSNILFDEHGSPFVTDFGLAKVFEDDCQHTRTGTIVGTPSYMSPEQAAGRPGAVCPQSDIYSLGAILYEMLTGLPPFREANPLDTLVQVLEGEPLAPRQRQPGVPRELEIICLKCLEKKPEHRYPSAAALADDLERYLRGEPIEAHASGLGTRLRRWVRREPALVARLTALAAAAGIVQTTYLIQGVDRAYHLRIMAVLGIWGIASLVLQRLLQRPTMREAGRILWIITDLVLLTTLLCVTRGPLGPLLIGYPLLIAGAGLFFQVRYVLLATVIAQVSYAALVLLRPDHFQELDPATQQVVSYPQFPVIFAAVLTVVGLTIALQVHRVRALSRYYESRRLP